MAKTKHNSLLALAYAQALLELANERQQTTQLAGELAGLKQILESQPTFVAFLSDPAIGETARGELLDRVLENNVSSLLLNFLRLLNAKGRTSILRAIIDAYADLLDRQLGKVEVDVTVAQALSEAELEEVRQRVSAALKKDAIVHQHVDGKIIGGLVLQVEDRLLDASVATELKAMRSQMLAAAPK